MAATGPVTAVVLPLETGFASADIDLVTEQDLLGDRLVRRKKRKKSADAFLAELAALSPGDLVVHMDHGIGRYEGLRSIPVGASPARLRDADLCGRRQALCARSKTLMSSRATAATRRASQLDKLGGEAWQRRKAGLKERIREIAHELLRTAAARALRSAPALLPEEASFGPFCRPFPVGRNRRPGSRHR